MTTHTITFRVRGKGPFVFALLVLAGLVVASHLTISLLATRSATYLEAPTDRILALTNTARSDNGLAKLTLDATLTVAAQSYAEIMSSTNCVTHDCGPEPEMATRLAAFRGVWLGENIAAGQPDADAVMVAWLASPGHRENILRPEFTLMGVGIASGGPYGNYWAVSFAGRAPEPPPQF